MTTWPCVCSPHSGGDRAPAGAPSGSGSGTGGDCGAGSGAVCAGVGRTRKENGRTASPAGTGRKSRRQTAGAAEARTQAERALRLHRSAKPDHEGRERRTFRASLPGAGRSGSGPPADRGRARESLAQRQTRTGADGVGRGQYSEPGTRLAVLFSTLAADLQSLAGGGSSRLPSSVRKARITFSSSRSNSAWSFSQPTKLAATRLVISAFLPPR